MKLEVRFDCSCLPPPHVIRNRITVILVILLVTWDLGGMPAVQALFSPR